MTALLQARGVSKYFEGRGPGQGRTKTVALQDVSLSIDGNVPAVIAVAGESGSGKTTLLRILLGLIEPTKGIVLYKGQEPRLMSQSERAAFRREVQAIFQDPFEVFNPFYKIDHVLTTPVRRFRLARTESERRTMIEAALVSAGLRPEETLGRYPHHLSGGQRQRIMVARAFLLKPRVILADEPVSMVDASMRATILEGLLKLKTEEAVSVVYVTHDLTTAYQISDSIMVLYRGCLVEVGDPERVIKEPLHPYTRLLVNSIPLPQAGRQWSDEALRIQTRDDVGRGCRFADRCPEIMPICTSAIPSLSSISGAQAVACHLYEGGSSVHG